MAGHAYVNKGNSAYNNLLAREGGYAHGPKQPVNWYVVETTTVERFRTPATGYTDFGDQEYIHSPTTLMKPKYTPKDHHEGYEPEYGSDDEKSSSPRYHGRESLMDKFLNKVQIKPSPKTSNHSSPNKYQPTSPVSSYPSEEAHLSRPRNLSGPNKYQPTTPVHNYPSEEAHLIPSHNLPGPNKYQPTSPKHTYPSEEIRPIKTRNLSDPNKYQPTSPVHSYPSEETLRTRNLSGPNRYQPTSPVHSYPSEETLRTRNLSGPNKYQPTSPVHNYPSEETFRTRNLSGPNKYPSTNPVHGHPFEELHPVRSRNLSNLGSENGQIGKIGKFSGPNKQWLSVGPPTTHHPMTTPTNDMNEALGFLEEAIYYSGPTRRGGGTFDTMSPRAQSMESEWQHARPAFVIDSQEAIRKYQGTRVP